MRPPTPQILDFGGGFWILGILDFGDLRFWILDFGEFGFWILGPESKIPQSKIQNPNFFGRFWGFWILDFGPLCSKSLCGPKFRAFWILGILDFGFWGFWVWILDLGFWILGILGILDFGDFGFWIFGILGILDFGFLEHYVADLYVQSLDFGDFGFWILGILDFGFWGSWVLDFGLGILDGHLVTKFWMLHKKRRLCTPNRVGGFYMIRV